MTLTETLTETTDASDPRTFDHLHTAQTNELGKVEFTTFDVDALDIQLGDLVAFYDDAVCIGGGTLRQKRTTKVSLRSEGKVTNEWFGVRPIGVFEYGAIRPARGLGSIATDRVWGWMGVTFDDTAWGTADEIAIITTTVAHHWQYVLGEEYYGSLDPDDSAFKDVAAAWVWDSSVGTTEFAPTGDCYFRQSFTVPTGVTRVEIELVADAQADLYLEGQREVSTEYIYGDPKPGDIKRQQVDVAEGANLLAVHAVNNPDYDLDGDHNPAGVAWAVWSIDPATGERDTVLARSDDTVKMLAYPVTPPGVTPGEVLLELLTEFQASGYFTWLDPTFTDALDSAGDAWPEVGEVGTKVGYSMWKLIQQLTTVYIDTDVDPDVVASLQEWNVWGKGNRGSNTAVVFAATSDPDTSNVTEHVVTEVLQRGNQVLHYSRFGWWLESEVFDGLKIDATLGLGALESFRAVQRYAQAELDQTAHNLVEHDISILPTGTGDVPMVDFDIGDRVTIAGGLEQVVELTWRRDRNGVIWWDTDENRGKK